MEQMLIVFILMVCMVKISETVKKYLSPGLLATENIFVYGFTPTDMDKMTDVEQSMTALNDRMKQFPYVETISNCIHLAPILDNGYLADSVVIDQRKIKTVIKASDEYGMSIFQPVMEEGTWLGNKKLDDGSDPAVVTRRFADKAGWTVAAGKTFGYQSRTFTVVGVAAGLKNDLFDPSSAAIVVPMYISRPNNNNQSGHVEYAVKVKEKEGENFNNDYFREFRRLIPADMADPVVVDVEVLKATDVFGNTFDLFLMGLPTVFLTIFAFIGTFGLFWLHAQKSFREFALRIALGATRRQLIGIVVSESLLVTLAALLPALLLSPLIFDYGVPQTIAVAITTFAMLLFSFVSAWYPAWTVSKVNPAEALQYE
jgi:ABC-type antimicrobial peptide transport system permease subunit